MIRIALNGFGRIGKMFVRTLLADSALRKSVQLVAINVGPADPAMVPYSLAYDSVYGTLPAKYEYKEGVMYGDGYEIKIYSETDIKKLSWPDIDWVVDVSGKFTSRKAAEQHLQAGARSVLISAPSKDPDVTIILGVNETDYKKDHRIVSLGSCTTNAVIPLINLVHNAYGIISATMTTTHAYTNSQALLDGVGMAHDWHRSRAAALNIVPASTGALEVAQQVIPALKGKLTGHALRVPVPTVSVVELVFMAEAEIVQEELHSLIRKSAIEAPSIIAVNDLPLVSSDFRGDTHSVTVDLSMTYVCGKLSKIVGWYDNEVGYSERLKEFLLQRAL